jgi:hypothetical protein
MLSTQKTQDFAGIVSDKEEVPADVMALLRESEITACKMLPAGSNAVFLLSLKQRGNTVKAIYKPCRGEAPLYDFPDGTLYRREAAAYLVSQALGWHLVPPTVIRDGPYGIGVVQQYVVSRWNGGYSGKNGSHVIEFKRIATLDWLINNADRKASHCILGEDGKIRAIDHGLTFHVLPKLRTVIWNFSGQPIPEDLVADFHSLWTQLNTRGGLQESLSRLLMAEEVEALKNRLRTILAHPVFPAWSGSYRSVPWPPY